MLREREKFLAHIDERIENASSMATRTAYQIIKVNYVNIHKEELFSREEILQMIMLATGGSKRNAVIAFNKWIKAREEKACAPPTVTEKPNEETGNTGAPESKSGAGSSTEVGREGSSETRKVDQPAG